MNEEKFRSINICFLYGYISSDIDFQFVYKNDYHISVATCTISHEKNIIKVLAYDEIADNLYSMYEKNCFIRVIGKLRNDYIEIEELII